MRYAVLGISTFVLMFCVGSAVARERGIGVSPANIVIGQNAEWPYTVPLTVTNLSSETENFEVTFEKDEGTIVSASPGRFSLDEGASARVLVTFERPRGAAEGLVKVVSIRTSVEGFTTGTGVKIPFRLAAELSSAQAKLSLAGASEAFGAGMMIATLILLWHLSGIIRLWIFNSEKR